MAQVAFSYGTTWISILGVVGIVLLIDIAIKNYYRYFKTSFDHLVQEAESNAHPVMYVALGCIVVGVVVVVGISVVGGIGGLW